MSAEPQRDLYRVAGARVKGEMLAMVIRRLVRGPSAHRADSQRQGE
jgi:hypothetical protein